MLATAPGTEPRLQANSPLESARTMPIWQRFPSSEHLSNSLNTSQQLLLICVHFRDSCGLFADLADFLRT